MALDINGYNAVFKKFTDFAQAKVDAGQTKAIADAHLQQPLLGGRRVLAVSTAQNDAVHKWTRTNDQYIVNDRTRALFKKAVADMFGGESKIPASVKEAMLLSDYDCGKPLTARRIMAVKAAIDADGTAKARSAKIRLETFDSAETKAAALALGYSKAELPKLARAAHLLAQATGKSEMEAMREVAEPGSKANRLMSYGGRFLENAENFADGLRLVDLFATWYDDLIRSMDAIGKTGAYERNRDYSSADTLTKHNAEPRVVDPAAKFAIEKFILEHLAFDPSANLKGTDAEALFGVGHNDAARFVLQDFTHSCTNSVANVPPAKRAVVYRTFNLFCSLAANAADHQRPASERLLALGDRGTLLGRVMRHLDELLALDAKGRLTARNVIKTCFPDMVKAGAAGNYDRKAIQDFLFDLDAEMSLLPEEGGKYVDIKGPLSLLMNSTGCTLKEGADAIRNGKTIPLPAYMSPGEIELKDLGTVEGGRSLIEGDLYRPANYSIKDGQTDILGPNAGFGFSFPGEGRFVANGSPEGRANIRRVGDKVEALCGRVHAKQASAVLMMLSQSGLGPINGGLRGHGIISSEHSPVDYALSKDADTGAVTIRYRSPEGLPFRFEWTVTVDVEGKATATPMTFEKAIDNLDNAAAKKMISASAKLLGVKLDREDTTTAATLLATHAQGMMAKNARVLANFIVNSLHNDGEIDEEMLANLAGDMKGWQEFDFGDTRLHDMGRKFVERQNNYLRDSLAKPDMYMDANPDVFTSLYSDANRGTWRIGGKTFPLGANPDAVLNEFLGAVKTPAARKVVSTLLNQGNLADLQCLVSKAPAPVGEARKDNDGVESIHTIKGGDMFVSRDYARDLAGITLAADVHYELDVSADGKTATVTVTQDMHLCTKDLRVDEYRIGKASVSQKTTIDLTKEMPVVTDVTFAQTFTPDEIQLGEA